MSCIPFIQVGTGNRGADLLRDLTSNHKARFRTAALVDVVPTFLDAAGELTGLPSSRRFDSLGSALNTVSEVEAVVIATPAKFHGALIREALLAGKHVWVEKPATYRYEEALELLELATERRRSVVVGNQYQYDPIERQLQRIVQAKKYGPPFLLTYTHHRHRPIPGAFTGPFPALWEQGVHSLDSILAILGHPKIQTVYALSLRPPHSEYPGETVTGIMTRFANGIDVHFLVTFDSQESWWEIRVECEYAALRLHANGWQRDTLEVLQAEQRVETIGPAEDLEPEMRDPFVAFHSAIVSGRTAPTSLEVNVQTLQWIDAAVRSSQEGQIIRL